MSFQKVNINQVITEKLAADPELEQLWSESRTEYRLLGELVKLRKSKGLSQVELAELTGNKQQVISRIENRNNSPTLKTLCSMLDVLGYDLQLVPKEQVYSDIS